MASAGAKINKLILDIQDCVQELKLEFGTTGSPIDDDNAAMHSLCDMLEHLLQAELKEKFSLLGNRKNYWDYFCKCLASRRGIHDGLKFVKSVSEFKTALGRGRAFIRYCLVHQCLADTLQQCLQDGRVTSDFYNTDSLLLQYEHTSCLISALYELNEVQFDISSHGHDLDVSWPTFARKLLGAHSSWRAPSRAVSLTSLTSIQSDANHSIGYDNNGNGYRPSSHLPYIESSVVDLLAKVDEIQQEQAETKDLARKTHEKMDKVAQSESWWQDQEEELKKKVIEVEHLAGEYAQKLEAVQIQQESEASFVQQEKNELEIKVRDLEYSKCELESHISSLTEQLLLKEETEHRLLASQELLKSKLEQRAEAPASETIISQMSSDILKVDFSTQVAETDLSTEIETKTNLLNDKDLIMVEIKTLREENERFKSQTEKWKKCITGFAEKLAIKERVNGHLEKQVEALKDAVAVMKDMMQVKMAETDSLRKLVQELKALHDVRTDVENSDDRLQTLENENIDLKEKMMNLNTNFENLKHELDCNLKLLSEKETSLILMVAKTQEMGLTLTQTEDRVAQLKQQLDASSLENQTLNSRLDTMREMLKKVEKAEEELEKLEAAEEDKDASGNKPSERNDDGSGPSSSTQQYTINFMLCNEQHLLPDDLSVITVVKRTVDRLQCLISEKQELQLQLRSSNEINSNLISKVQEQEEKLTTVTFELCETKALVEKLKVAHSKLQTSEAILRYELKEKRSVVERMKQMLESSRAQWMRIRQKHTESELEWQSLRADFASRVKQESVESGFVEDTNASKSEERESLIDDSDKQPESPSEMATSSDGTDMDAPAIQASSPPTTSELEDLPEAQADDDDDSTSANTGRSRTRTRLRIMEEQCRLLYSKLVASVKKSEFLEWKLSQLHKQHGGTDDDENSSKDESESGLRDVNANFDIIYVPYENKVKKPEGDTSESQESIMDGEQQQEVANSEEEAAESLSGDTENSATDDGAMEQTAMHLIESGDYEPLSPQESLSPDVVDGKVEPLAMAQALPKRIELLRRKKEDLELNMRKMTEEKSESDAREANLRSQLDAMKLSLLEKDSQMDILTKEKGDLMKRADFIMRKEREEKEARFEAVIKAKQEVQIKLGSLQNQIEERQGQIVKLETSLTDTLIELAATKKSMEQELATLQFQLSSETLKNELAIKSHTDHEMHIANMQERISEQEGHISLLEEELKGIKHVRNEELERQQMEFQELQMRLSAREEECASLNDDLKETSRQYDIEKNKNAEITTLHNEMSTENGKLKDELAELYACLQELKKVKMQLVLEKDFLWKRSQHLSFIQNVQATDRWLKDDEVDHCLGCKAEFTFILRKHHCRRCGKVYCKSCCNHFVMTTASSRRVRVCNECLLNHSQIGYEAITLDNDEEHGESSPSTPSELEEQDLSGITSSSCTPDRDIEGPVTSLGDVYQDENKLEAEGSSAVESPSTSSSTCTDEKLASERSLLGRLFASWSNSPKSKEVLKDIEGEFCVISDDEIIKSLSHSCPYAPLGEGSSDPSSYMCPTRTLDEMLSEFSDGKPREIWVNAGKSYAVPVMVSKMVTITWKFSSEPKSIAFSLVYHALPSDDHSYSDDGTKRRRRLIPPTQILYPVTHCNSHLSPMHGRVVAKNIGIYTFYFINGFSRFMAKKIKFLLSLEEKLEPLKDTQEQEEKPQTSSTEESDETDEAR